MKSLRLYKIFDWFLVALSYVAAVLLYNGGMLYMNNPQTIEVMNSLRIAGLALYGVLLFLHIPVYVMGIIYGITAKESMAKHNMIVKLVSVPFFVINCISLFLLSAHITNISGWLIFLVIPLSVIVTFAIMFRSSLPDVVYFARSYVRKTLKVTPKAVAALILSFIFCLDVVGGIILFKEERKQRPDIAARIKAERLKAIEDWKVKKHMGLLSLKIVSIVTTTLLTLASIAILVIDVTYFIQDTESVRLLFEGVLFIPSVVIIILLPFIKMVFGIIYGKQGDEDPTKFLFIMKMIDILPSVAILIISAICLMAGVALDALAIFFVAFIAVVVVIFMIIALLGTSIAAYASSIPFMISAIFCIYSTSLSVFTYYINQRAMKNRKFANWTIIACLVCLWVPILDIPAMAILKNKAKTNTVLGDKPVLVAEQEGTLCEI